MISMADRGFLSRKEASRYLIQKGASVSVRSLELMAEQRSTREGPKFTKFRSVRGCIYKKEDLDAWLERERRVIG